MYFLYLIHRVNFNYYIFQLFQLFPFFSTDNRPRRPKPFFNIKKNDQHLAKPCQYYSKITLKQSPHT